jgi:hypothetical protein
VNVYKLRSPLRFARRPVSDRPTDELALLKCRAADEWLFLGAWSPLVDAAIRDAGLPGATR